MPTKSQKIRMDEDIKNKAEALFASLGFTLSEAVNLFSLASIEANGFPFPVKLRELDFIEKPRAKATKKKGLQG